MLALKTILAGAWSAVTQGLWSDAAAVWNGEQVEQAKKKYRDHPSFHLLKNVGQEWLEDSVRRETADSIDPGKLGYKFGSLLIVAGVIAGGVVFGALAFVVGLVSGVVG